MTNNHNRYEYNEDRYNYSKDKNILKLNNINDDPSIDASLAYFYASRIMNFLIQKNNNGHKYITFEIIDYKFDRESDQCIITFKNLPNNITIGAFQRYVTQATNIPVVTIVHKQNVQFDIILHGCEKPYLRYLKSINSNFTDRFIFKFISILCILIIIILIIKNIFLLK